jgi:hypothetical protein
MHAAYTDRINKSFLVVDSSMLCPHLLTQTYFYSLIASGMHPYTLSTVFCFSTQGQTSTWQALKGGILKGCTATETKQGKKICDQTIHASDKDIKFLIMPYLPVPH